MCSLLLAHGADPTLLNCHSKAAVDAAPTRELQDKLSCMYCLHACSIRGCSLVLCFSHILEPDSKPVNNFGSERQKSNSGQLGRGAHLVVWSDKTQEW